MSPRTPKQLLVASKEFATEHRPTSWWCVWSTIFIYATLFGIAVSNLPMWVRIPCSLASAMVYVRLFVIYHDYQHGAILRGSRIAQLLMTIYGLVSLNPPSVWNRSHDHHHKHNSKTYGTSIGSYPIMTTTAYETSTPTEKLAYGVARHPVTIFLGYFSVFLWGMSLRPLLQSPSRHLDAAVSVVVHFSLFAWMASFGTDVLLLGFVFPLFIASFVGAYLFYAQHNFPSAKLHPRSDWTRVDAALHSSSFIPMWPVMHWLTGNIGYHHVHHLNARIPFYRLPEAMNALEEMQSPGTTTLGIAGIRSCLRLKLWNPDTDQLVGYNGV